MGGQIFDAAPRLNGWHVDCDVPVIIGLDTDDGPEHCLWDQSDRNAAGDPVFAAELVMDGGIRQPVLCRANGVIKQGGRAEVGVGRRRLQAARLIKHKPQLVREVLKQLDVQLRVEPILVPLLIEKHTDDEWRRIVAAENAQRKDLSFRDKVAQALRMLERVKNKGAVAAVYGVSLACVAEWERTKDLDDRVLALVGPGRGQQPRCAPPGKGATERLATSRHGQLLYCSAPLLAFTCTPRQTYSTFWHTSNGDGSSDST